jgi:hypothetical protein
MRRWQSKGVELGLDEVMATGEIAVVPGPGEPRRRVNELMLPGPQQDGAEILSDLLGAGCR